MWGNVRHFRIYVVITDSFRSQIGGGSCIRKVELSHDSVGRLHPISILVMEIFESSEVLVYSMIYTLLVLTLCTNARSSIIITNCQPHSTVHFGYLRNNQAAPVAFFVSSWFNRLRSKSSTHIAMMKDVPATAIDIAYAFFKPSIYAWTIPAT